MKQDEPFVKFMLMAEEQFEHWYQLTPAQRKMIPPPEGCKHPYELAVLLAKRFGAEPDKFGPVL